MYFKKICFQVNRKKHYICQDHYQNLRIMTEVEILLKNKDTIIQNLFEWTETFTGEVDEDGEETKESYNHVFDLLERFEKENIPKKI
jgi:hypothetical protein